jgi:hypothetical protein
MAMTSTIKVTSRPRDIASGYDKGVPRERTTPKTSVIGPIASRP